ncbi:hypothetical protein LOZ15_000382 [Ophidiomyces ophidiicola]|nr:hypothetical protein LOZ15_000382 [Ophidiomyces ophidiicola]
MTKLLAILGTLAVLPAVSLAVALPAPIIMGTPSKLGANPSMAVLHQNGGSGCGATLIGPKHAITAAHCITNRVADYSVRVGSLARFRDGQVSRVSRIKIHERYREGRSFDNDIALLILEEPIREGQNVRYAKLPKQGSDMAANSQVTAVGWGNTYPNPKQDSSSRTLMEVTIPVQARNDCQKLYGVQPMTGQSSITENMICAGGNGGDSCFGDSGGPLYEEATARSVIVGIVSFGESCGARHFPGVYTRVAQYIDWIKANGAGGQGGTDTVDEGQPQNEDQDQGLGPVNGHPGRPVDQGGRPINGNPGRPVDQGGRPINGNPGRPVDQGGRPINGNPGRPVDQGGRPINGNPGHPVDQGGARPVNEWQNHPFDEGEEDIVNILKDHLEKWGRDGALDY